MSSRETHFRNTTKKNKNESCLEHYGFRMLFDDIHHNNICDSDEEVYDLNCYNVRQVLRLYVSRKV